MSRIARVEIHPCCKNGLMDFMCNVKLLLQCVDFSVKRYVIIILPGDRESYYNIIYLHDRNQPAAAENSGTSRMFYTGSVPKKVFSKKVYILTQNNQKIVRNSFRLGV